MGWTLTEAKKCAQAKNSIPILITLRLFCLSVCVHVFFSLPFLFSYILLLLLLFFSISFSFIDSFFIPFVRWWHAHTHIRCYSILKLFSFRHFSFSLFALCIARFVLLSILKWSVCKSPEYGVCQCEFSVLQFHCHRFTVYYTHI